MHSGSLCADSARMFTWRMARLIRPEHTAQLRPTRARFFDFRGAPRGSSTAAAPPGILPSPSASGGGRRPTLSPAPGSRHSYGTSRRCMAPVGIGVGFRPRTGCTTGPDIA